MRMNEFREKNRHRHNAAELVMVAFASLTNCVCNLTRASAAKQDFHGTHAEPAAAGAVNQGSSVSVQWTVLLSMGIASPIIYSMLSSHGYPPADSQLRCMRVLMVFSVLCAGAMFFLGNRKIAVVVLLLFAGLEAANFVLQAKAPFSIGVTGGQ